MKGIFSFSRGSILNGPDVETIESGGGAATPVAEEFGRFLESLFTGGTARGPATQPVSTRELIGRRAAGIPDPTPGFGPRTPVDQTTDIMQALNALIAGPDVSGQQGAIQKVIQTSTERQAANIRERFTAGGGSRGTPSAVAEGLFRSEVVPRTAAVTGELELRANRQRMESFFQLMQVLLGFSGKGIPQAKTDVIVQPGALEILAGLGEGAGETAAALGAGG
ncbi:hypothetical protein LCGC14_2778800 [marine sediment metagenome]|uniref:Uncharacterized protein n=1 Tax=marine sediment metagenome TaxID=412755 RepID=A0A0F9B2R5_9ZZZZ